MSALEEKEADCHSPGQKNFHGCVDPAVSQSGGLKVNQIHSQVVSGEPDSQSDGLKVNKVTFGLSKLAPLDRLGCA